MADVKWIKIVTELFDDEKIQLIETLPEADTIITIWFKLLCLAGKCNNSGLLMLNGKIPYTDVMLATIFRRKLTSVQLSLQVFVDYEMIEIIDGVYAIHNWEKHQELDALNKIREQTRARVSEYRDRQKLSVKNKNLISEPQLKKCNVTRNVTVTHCNATEREIELEIKKEKNTTYSKERNVTEVENPFVEFAQDNEKLLEAFKSFEEMRKVIKKPLTLNAKKLIISQLENKYDKSDWVEVINQSVINSWQGLYPLKNDSFGSSSKTSTRTKICQDDDEWAETDMRKFIR